jgi:hypothetical protein
MKHCRESGDVQESLIGFLGLRTHRICPEAIDESSIEVSCPEVFALHDGAEEGQSGVDSFDGIFVERASHPINRDFAGLTPRAQFSE